MPSYTRGLKKRGRPKELPGKDYKYMSVALAEPEREALSDWAWRLKMTVAELMRELIIKGLRPYMEDLNREEKYPAPPPAPKP